MFLFNKSMETSGTLRMEKFATPIVASGYKTMGEPSYASGTYRFVVAKRNRRVIPSEEGRTEVDRLTVQFGWDQLKEMSGDGLTLTPGSLMLDYSNETYRMIDKDDFGSPYDRNYNPLGVIEITFERQKERAE